MIYFTFGEMGIGKNFVGERIAAKLGCDFVDGDDFLTPEMQAKVKAFKSFTKQDLDKFMVRLVEGIVERYKEGEDLVVAQALYRQEHRELVKSELLKQNCKIIFVWIPVPSLAIHIERLWGRDKGLMWVLYGMLNKPFFQKPIGKFLTVHNFSEGHLNHQLERLF
ncbi:MAG: shikimate kinase [Promethearchaeota archaeon]|jgi:gluconate kinase